MPFSNPDYLLSLFTRGTAPRIVAAINVSPESFFSGSVYTGPDQAASAARKAQAAGASMIDIGAMSTAPYKETQISPEEECRRMGDAVAAVREAVSLPISADTQRAAVAEAALDAGATVVNDISGLRDDPDMAALCAERGAGVILMAKDRPDLDEHGEPPHLISKRLLEEALDRATAAGIPGDRIILDPGVGFFRHRSVPWHEFDLDLLRHLDVFRAMEYPVLIGASRKSFLGKLLGKESPNERLTGSLAVAAWCALARIEWLRVHDVQETADVLRMMELLRRGK